MDYLDNIWKKAGNIGGNRGKQMEKHWKHSGQQLEKQGNWWKQNMFLPTRMNKHLGDVFSWFLALNHWINNAGSLNQEIQRGRLWNKIKAMPDVTTAWNSTPRMHCWEVTRCGEHEAALARDKVYVQKLLKEDQISVISAPFTENDHRLLVLPCGIKTIRWCWGWNRRALPRAGKRMRTAWPVSRRWMDTGPALRQRLSKMQPLWNHDMWLQ